MRIRRSVVLGTLAVYIFFYGPNVLFAQAALDNLLEESSSSDVIPDTQPSVTSPQEETKPQSSYPYNKPYKKFSSFRPITRLLQIKISMLPAVMRVTSGSMVMV